MVDRSCGTVSCPCLALVLPLSCPCLDELWPRVWHFATGYGRPQNEKYLLLHQSYPARPGLRVNAQSFAKQSLANMGGSGMSISLIVNGMAPPRRTWSRFRHPCCCGAAHELVEADRHQVSAAASPSAVRFCTVLIDCCQATRSCSDAGVGRRRQDHHHHRGAVSRGHASGAIGLDRARRSPVRLLPIGADHGRGGLAQATSRTRPTPTSMPAR